MKSNRLKNLLDMNLIEVQQSKTAKILQDSVTVLNMAERISREIDWLLDGEIDEEIFLERMNELERDLDGAAS